MCVVWFVLHQFIQHQSDTVGESTLHLLSQSLSSGVEHIPLGRMVLGVGRMGGARDLRGLGGRVGVGVENSPLKSEGSRARSNIGL